MQLLIKLILLFILLCFIQSTGWSLTYDGVTAYPVVVYSGNQDSLKFTITSYVGNGNGNSYYVWRDTRNGNYDIYAQVISAFLTPLLDPNGIAICTVENTQQNPAIVTYQDTTAIITWEDYRNTTSNPGQGADIYAQGLSTNGILWAPNGIAICTAADDQINPSIVTDNINGAIICWMDKRNGFYNIYAQRVDENGSTYWAPNGLGICTSAYNQLNPSIITDGSGGAIITWMDYRYGNADIYAQRINSNGSTLWQSNGVSICTALMDQTNPLLVSDGNQGTIITWTDARNQDLDIYAQRVDSTGNVLWTSNGVAICTAVNNQQNPVITQDFMNGGAIIAWVDYRDTTNFPNQGADIYAQRIAGNGTTSWTPNGVVVCNAPNNQTQLTICYDYYWNDPRYPNDGVAGMVVIAWTDERNGNDDIYFQQLNTNGNIRWATNGVAICTAVNEQSYPSIARFDVGNAPGPSGRSPAGSFLVWQDFRNGTDFDIYMWYIGTGNVPVEDWFMYGDNFFERKGYQTIYKKEPLH